MTQNTIYIGFSHFKDDGHGFQFSDTMPKCVDIFIGVAPENLVLLGINHGYMNFMTMFRNEFP